MEGIGIGRGTNPTEIEINIHMDKHVTSPKYRGEGGYYRRHTI